MATAGGSGGGEGATMAGGRSTCGGGRICTNIGGLHLGARHSETFDNGRTLKAMQK